MLEILFFIFSSFERFCGMLILILVTGWALSPLIIIKHVRPAEDE